MKSNDLIIRLDGMDPDSYFRLNGNVAVYYENGVIKSFNVFDKKDDLSSPLKIRETLSEVLKKLSDKPIALSSGNKVDVNS